MTGTGAWRWAWMLGLAVALLVWSGSAAWGAEGNGEAGKPDAKTEAKPDAKAEGKPESTPEPKPAGYTPWEGNIIVDQASIVLGVEVLAVLKRGDPVKVVTREGDWLGVVSGKKLAAGTGLYSPAGKMEESVRGWILAKDVGGWPQGSKAPGADDGQAPGPPPDRVPNDPTVLPENMPVKIAWKTAPAGQDAMGMTDIVFEKSRDEKWKDFSMKEVQLIAECDAMWTEPSPKAAMAVAPMHAMASASGKPNTEIYMVDTTNVPFRPYIARFRWLPLVDLSGGQGEVKTGDLRIQIVLFGGRHSLQGVEYANMKGDGQLRVALYKPKAKGAEEKQDPGERVSNIITMPLVAK